MLNQDNFFGILVASILCNFIIAVSSAQANPEGVQVAAGTVKITTPSDNTLQVQTSDKAIINWQSFNIKPNETVRFVQPGSDSIVLNRINPDHGASQINGHLTANGRVILINGAGVFFGPSAYVNVSSLIASTADISDANFMSGKYIFNQASSYSGAIVNQGTLIAAKHGLIALVGNAVSNEGLIEANMGAVVLASGNKFTIGLNGSNSLINFTIDEEAPHAAQDSNGKQLTDAINNSGTVIADGGRVIIAAKTAKDVVDHAINMQGIIQANTVDQVDGQIILSGSNNGDVKVTGQLNARGQSENQQGGKIIVLGENIQAEDHAFFDVSGEAGGGEIRLGGDSQEFGSEQRAADSHVYVGPNVTLKADAIKNGNGGKIVISSPDAATFVYGNLSAQGGKLGGNKGSIEISGRALDVSGIKQIASVKNLDGISFEERAAVEDIINTLAASADNPYAASLPMMMSAELGDMKGYMTSSSQMLKLLEMLDNKPESFPQWMQSNSFKAWMWGRVLLAADSVNDVSKVSLAQDKLTTLLNGKITDKDNPAFFAWAWGYRAALNQSEYKNTGKEKMIDGARQLTAEYKNSGSHDQLSNALWAWVMNIQAAARAGDKVTYETIKKEIRMTAGTESVSTALEAGLLRTAESNDYPAWAMAIVRNAAATMGDTALFQEIGTTLSLSTQGANKAGANAEYVFSVLDNQLAVQTEQNGQRPRPSSLIYSRSQTPIPMQGTTSLIDFEVDNNR